MTKPRIILDAGHPGRGVDPGAVGPAGSLESDVTLAVVLRTGKLLAPIAEVGYTRTSEVRFGPDINADLAARARIADEFRADILVSVHANGGSPRPVGSEIYTLPGQSRADILAESIITAVEATIPELPWRKDTTDGDGDKEARFYMLRKPQATAVLWEMDFISNPERERMLRDPVYQDRLALALAKGIAAFYGVSLKGVFEEAKVVDSAGNIVHGKMIDGSMWAPVRPLAALLGRGVAWNQASFAGALSGSYYPVGTKGTADRPVFCIGNERIEGYQLDGVSFVPVRLAVVAAGLKLEWDGATQTSKIKEVEQ